MSAASPRSEDPEPVDVPVDRDAIPPGQAIVVRAAGREVAVFNLSGDLVAVDHRCPHRRGPLADGVVKDGVLTCPWHWYRFELATGRCVNASGLRLRRHLILEVDGQTYVRVPPAPPQRSWRETLLAAARGEEEDRP